MFVHKESLSWCGGDFTVAPPPSQVTSARTARQQDGRTSSRTSTARAGRTSSRTRYSELRLLCRLVAAPLRRVAAVNVTEH